MQNFILSLLAVAFLFASCESPFSANDLQNGDILFVGNVNADLSEAIDQVTKTEKGTSYSHMGMIVKNSDGTFVIDAYPKSGVSLQTLEDFLAMRNDSSTAVEAYRVSELSEKQFAEATGRAEKEIGQPYDRTYVMSEPGFYCSELVYEAFEPFETFELHAMSFTDDATGEIPQTWVDHYAELGIEVPQGKPGCNPNGMAADEDLVFLGRIQ